MKGGRMKSRDKEGNRTKQSIKGESVDKRRKEMITQGQQRRKKSLQRWTKEDEKIEDNRSRHKEREKTKSSR